MARPSVSLLISLAAGVRRVSAKETRSAEDRRWWGAVGLISLAALGLRLAHLFQIRASDPFYTALSVDPQAYHRWAVALSQGDWLGSEVFFMGPLYPYVLGAFYWVFGPHLIVGYLLQALLGAATCALTAIVARRVGGMAVGVTAGLMMCFYQQAIFFGGVLLITNLLTPLVLVSVWVLLRGVEAPSRRIWFAAGIVAGLVTLARPNGLLFVALVPAALIAAGTGRTRWSETRRLAPAFLLGAVIVIAPVTLRNWVAGQDFVIVTAHGGTNLYVGNNPSAEGVYMLPPEFAAAGPVGPLEQAEVFAIAAIRDAGAALTPSQVSRYWSRRAWESLVADPARAVRLLGRKLELWVNHAELSNVQDVSTSRQFSWVLRLPLLTFGVLAPLGLLGMALRVRELRREWPLALAIVANAASLVIVFVAARYRMPVVPLLIVYAAAALVWAVGRMRERSFRPLALAGAAILAIALVVNRDIMFQDEWVGWFNLASAYQENGEMALAVEQYSRTVAAAPDFLAAHEGLARALEQVDGQEALACLAWRNVRDLGARDEAWELVAFAVERRTRLRCVEGAPGGGRDGPPPLTG